MSKFPQCAKEVLKINVIGMMRNTHVWSLSLEIQQLAWNFASPFDNNKDHFYRAEQSAIASHNNFATGIAVEPFTLSGHTGCNML